MGTAVRGKISFGRVFSGITAAAVFLALTLMGCSKDEEVQRDSKLVCQSDEAWVHLSSNYIYDDDDAPPDALIFRSNGDLFFVDKVPGFLTFCYDPNFKMGWSTSGSDLALSFGGRSNKIRYSVDGDLLTITEDGESDTFKKTDGITLLQNCYSQMQKSREKGEIRIPFFSK